MPHDGASSRAAFPALLPMSNTNERRALLNFFDLDHSRTVRGTKTLLRDTDRHTFWNEIVASRDVAGWRYWCLHGPLELPPASTKHLSSAGDIVEHIRGLIRIRSHGAVEYAKGGRSPRTGPD